MSAMSDLDAQIQEWLNGRASLVTREDSGHYPSSGEWADSDDEAAEILTSMCDAGLSSLPQRRYTRAEHEAAKRLGLSDSQHRGAIWWATGPYWPSEVAAMADRARQTIADCELLGQAMAREWEVL